jgi:hypothetical protein
VEPLMVDNQLQVEQVDNEHQLLWERVFQALAKVQALLILLVGLDLSYYFDHEHILPLNDEFHEVHEIELNPFSNLLIPMLH